MSTIYDVLRRPLITEKTNYQAGKLHQYVFEVADDATRTLVKDAVEKIFNVTVLRVNLINVPAKQSRRGRSRRVVVTREGYKKAIVTLAPEDSIPLFEGV
ncbi:MULTISPECIES: 50S ribosomal protein L23 [Anaerolinea]|uniref:Large ribosomal subunit protein uL23 n=1 Tax=Anaerolinea thermophila (strain DSM 14523 / JCM 11388 / NBRC 100420 / UNI-1) TaxID=926569 RepID=E8N3M6_ANATU|nr:MULTISPECIES: 50S ribosomal protein L23 [Anaerolinea]BAJ63040.1 50S ribosomal protein L23 [Anaerolinea thermophila UNI-1]